MGGNELRTPLEMALKREAEGELAGGCIKCDYCVVVQGGRILRHQRKDAAASVHRHPDTL